MREARRLLLVSFVLGSGLVLAPKAFAQTAATALEQGRACLEANRFDDAVVHLRQAFREDPANLEVSALLGRAAFNAGDYETAAAAFDRVLEMRPDLDPARLELARSYYHLGLYTVAEGLFNEVASGAETPADVRRTIDEYLAKIRETRCPHRFSGALNLTIARDDNARVSPGGTITIPGLPRLSLPVDRDVFTAQSLLLEHRWATPVRGLAWVSEFLGYDALYLDQDDLDVQYLRLDTGPRWRSGRTSLGLGINGAYMEKDYQRYLRTYGARAFGGLALARNASVRLEVSAEDRRYWQDEEADGVAGRISLGPTWTLGRHTLMADLGVEAHDAQEGWESYRKTFSGLGYQVALPWRLAFLSSYLYENWRFREPEPLSASRRRDDVHSLSVGLRRLLGRRAAVELRHKVELSHSNSDLYDYHRNVTSLSVTYAF